jgi:ABC-type multidrug transport system fused ATPase/permease subunit
LFILCGNTSAFLPYDIPVVLQYLFVLFFLDFQQKKIQMLIFLFFSFLFDSQGSIINSCVCALLGLSIAFTVSWRLSLALLGALPLLGAAEGAQQTLMISGEKNIGKALNASAEIVNESVKSAKEIQAFGLQSVVSRHLL